MSVDPGVLAYREEAGELLAEIEETLLELENDPGNKESIARAFRSIHTIKGSGSMFGFSEIARFTHEVETAMDKVRGGKLEMTKDLMSLILASKDHISALLSSPPDGTEADRQASDALIVQIRAASDPDAAPGEPAPPPAPAVEPPRQEEARQGRAAPVAAPPCLDPAKTETWWIRFRPQRQSMALAGDPLGMVEELAGLGRLWDLPHVEDVPAIEAIDPELMYLWWDFILITDQGENAIRDVFIFASEAGLTLARLTFGTLRQSDKTKLFGLIESCSGKTDQEVGAGLAAWVAGQVGERAKAPPAVPKPVEPEPKDKLDTGPSGIRVDSARLDSLVNLVGELVIIQSRLTQAAQVRQEPLFMQIAEDLERLSASMRDQALGIRMQPIGTMFSALRRLVRDLSGELGKEVEFVAEGAKTELDKNVIDRIKDPLIHVLRNCLDHGIEAPDVRAASGKPRRGTVKLTAAHSGGEVVISVQDDGAGIDLDRVRAKAVERGLIAPDALVSDKEAMNLIFLPGFSTAAKISSVSGRGVGMDVVKKSISNLRGGVEMTSQSGQGSSLTFRLPLTLAIIDGLMVRVRRDFFILPLVSVEACMERFIAGPLRTVESMDRMGKMIPCVSLRRLFGVSGEQPGYERVVIVGMDGQEVGLAVDAVVGQQQAVIKSLSRIYTDVEWVSGTTINGDGGIALILDVPKIVRFAEAKAQAS
jgi:two-component system, chemotaxis family, sensor kinase CheA